MKDVRSQPATKGDILDLRNELEAKFDGRLQQLKDEFLASQTQLKDELVETIRDSQTEVLKAFYGYSQTTMARFQELDQLSQTDTIIKRRMEAIESRVLELEKRLNMPPNAA